MGDVLAFLPRPAEAASSEPVPMTEAEIRTRLGEALQTALDAADHIIAVLDRMDGDDDAYAGPALAAPEEQHGSRVVWLRNNDSGREAETPATILPVVAAEHTVAPVPALPWGGSGNVLAAAGVALLGMVGGR